MLNQIKVVIINRDAEGNLIVKDQIIDDTLETYYNLLNCNTIDIVNRKIRHFRACFVIDDEYLLKGAPKEPPIAVFEGNGREEIFNALVITGTSDNEGNLTSLSDFQVELIKSSISKYRRISTESYFNFEPIFEALSYTA